MSAPRSEEGALTDSASAASELEWWRSTFAKGDSAILAPVATGFERRGAIVDPTFDGMPGAPARVHLPWRATGRVRLEDESSHVAIAFALRGVQGATLEASRGIALYRGAFHGADVLHRARPDGTEDYVAFASRPASEELSYDVDVSRVRGLRLVESTLELLDERGAPRLRVAPPYVVTANGTRTPATIAVEGCAYDVNPAAPWGRAVTAPGAPSCVVRIAWKAASYPLLVDPQWTTTGSLVTARGVHTASVLASGKVLIAGGDTQQNDSTALASAELYDPLSQTFASTGSMAAARANHTATVLGSGKVLIVGGDMTAGFPPVASYQPTEIYDPLQGTFSPGGTIGTPRQLHTATLLATGKVLVVGGYNASGLVPTNELYDPGSDSFSPTGALGTLRGLHTANLLATGDVLVAGGEGSSSFLASAEIYDTQGGTFSPTGSMSTGRAAHTATVLPSGKVLVAGGQGSTILASAELYDPTAKTFSNVTSQMSTGRRYGAAMLLDSGKVLLPGGDNGNGGSGTAVDLFDPATSMFSAAAPMQTARRWQTVTAVSPGHALVAGGLSGFTLGMGTSSAEIWVDLVSSTPCTAAADCDSGYCVDGVCCDTACAGQCEACDVQGHVGTCSPVAGNPHGSRAACGSSGACSSTCDGTTTKACTFPPTACGSTCANAQETDSVCDGAGNCAAQPPHSCNNLICADAIQCKSSCASNSDCVTGYTCGTNGTCQPGGTCTDDHHSLGANGIVEDCTPFKCDTSGSCKSSCISVDDCVAPNVCDSTGHCATPPASSSGGCSQSSGSRGAWAWLLVGVGMFASRVRRRER